MTSQEVPHPPAAPALQRIDRADAERAASADVAQLRDEPGARVIAVHGDRTLMAGGALRAVPVAAVREGVQWALLGRDGGGAPILLAATAATADAPVADPVAASQAGEGTDAVWAPLRGVAAELEPDQARLLVEAVSLGRWLIDAPFCPACGGVTRLIRAGWARECTACGREHFPRTDPAVIVTVADASDTRLLLGRNAVWGDRVLYSAFAGFVEAGESLESAIHRELAEEAGVALDELRYGGSQPWPYPRSLMIGFHAVARDAAAARPDGEEIVDVRWFTREELRAARSGEGDVELPGRASIAHRLISRWLDGHA
jgi:NAD+ diphosphatase